MRVKSPNPLLKKLDTDAGTKIDRAYLAHLEVPAAKAPAASSTGVLAATNLGADAQTITTGITNPAVPRNLRIVGNVDGITGKVKITGTNFAGKVITEEIQANGTTAKDGNLAFKTVTKIELPVQNHTPAAQTETIEVTKAPENDGDITVTVTAVALGDDSPVSVTVSLEAAVHNDVTKTATAIVTELNEDDAVSAAFTASNEAGVITLTANEPAANDDTLAIAVTAGETGMTVGDSTNGTPGVPYDKISVGWGDKLGLPYFLTHNTVLAAYLGGIKEANAPSVSVDADDLENNTIDLYSDLNGTAVDIYFVV